MANQFTLERIRSNNTSISTYDCPQSVIFSFIFTSHEMCTPREWAQGARHDGVLQARAQQYL